MAENLDCLLFAVKDILVECPSARNSDDELVRLFSKRFCKQEIDLKALGISMATIKTLERTRRLCQRMNPDLKANDVITNIRVNNEIECRTYYSGWYNGR